VTLFVADTSGYQPNFDYAGSGMDAFVIKATEGSTYRNPSFPTQLARARATGKPTIAYHYVRSGDVAGQLTSIYSTVPNSVSVALDLENGGDVATARALSRSLRTAGWMVPLLYCPAWWLSANGGLNTDTRDIGALWSSQYPVSGSGASPVYAAAGADHGAGWSAYGGQSPVLWQFSSSISVGGYSAIDVSAFRGSRAQLAALFSGSPTGGLCVMEFLIDLSTRAQDGTYPDCARVQGTSLVGCPSAEAFALQAASTPGAVIIYGMQHQQYQDAVATSNAIKQLPTALATLTAAVQAIPAASGGTGGLTKADVQNAVVDGLTSVHGNTSWSIV
jgi:hypothetical protein